MYIICSDEYRKLGLGSLLFEESMKFLETTKPLVTFTEDKLPMFEDIKIALSWINSWVRFFLFCFQKHLLLYLHMVLLLWW